MSPEEMAGLDWEKQGGLLPAVVQDANTGRVLMLGYMNQEALDATLDTGHVTFWSRTKERLWTKGETSGNALQLVEIQRDCDNDSLLVTARPNGPTCHLGTVSCFTEAPGNFLAELDAIIKERKLDRPDGSYTAKLFASGTKGIAQKVGEEGVEAALAAVAEGDEALLGEAADLLYHLIVLLRSRDLALSAAMAVLKQRHEAQVAAAGAADSLEFDFGEPTP